VPKGGGGKKLENSFYFNQETFEGKWRKRENTMLGGKRKKERKRNKIRNLCGGGEEGESYMTYNNL